MKKVLIFLTFAFSYLFSSNISLAANYGKTDQERIYELGVYVFISDDFNKINKSYFNEKTLSKYKKKSGYIITCIAKGSPAEKSGLELYDHIIGVDNDNFFYIWFADDREVVLTIERNGKIIKKKIKPIKSSLISKKKFTCNQEYKPVECGRNFLYQNDSFKKIFQCLLEANSTIIPFFKDDKWWMLTSFKFTFYDYVWKVKDPIKINEHLPLARKYIKDTEEYLSKNSLEKKIKEEILVDLKSIEGNIHAASRFVEDRTLKNTKSKTIILKEDIDRVKNKIISIEKEKSFNNYESKEYYKNKIGFLIDNREIAFVQKHWNTVIKNIDWQKEENIKYFTFYVDYAESFSKTGNFLQTYKTLEEVVQKLEFFDKKNIDAFIKINDCYSAMYFAASLIYTKTFKKSDLKNIEKNVSNIKKSLNDFENLDEKTKILVRKKSRNFFYNSYLAIANSASYTMNFSDSIRYSTLGINEVDKDSRFHESAKLTLIVTRLTAYSMLGNIDEVVNNYYLFRNIASKHINSQRGLTNISHSGPNLAMQLYAQGLYEESENLVILLDNNIDYSKPLIMNDLQMEILYLVKANLLIKKNKFSEAIKILKISSKRCNPANTSDMTTYYSCLSFMKLLEAYYKNNQVYEFEKTYTQKLQIHPSKDDIKAVIQYAKTTSADGTAGLFYVMLDYYKKNNLNKNYNDLSKFSKKYVKISLDQINKNTAKAFTSSIDVYEGLVSMGTYLALDQKKEGIDILKSLRKNIIKEYQSNIFQSHLSPKFKAKNIINSYFLIAEKINDNNFTKDTYELSQIIKNSIVAKEIQKSLAKRSIKNKTKYSLISKYQKLQVDLVSHYKKDEYDLNARNPEGFTANEWDVSTQKYKEKISSVSNKSFQSTDEIRKEINILSKKISNEFPEYYDLIKPQPIKISTIQKFLKTDEALLDYFFSSDTVYVFAITKNKFQLFSSKLSSKEANILENKIRNSLMVNSKGGLEKFDTRSAYQLYMKIFRPFQDFIKDIKHLFVVPDGPIRSIPLHMLITSDRSNCYQCKDSEWLMKKYNFSYLPSINFVKNNTKTIQQKAIDNLIEKTKLIKNNLIKNKGISEIQNTYLGIGDPVFEKKIDTNIKNKNNVLASFFQRGGIVANTDQIKNIYGEVPGSNEEIRTVAKLFTENQSTLLLRKDATEINLKKINLSKFKVIHFATHGEMSGAIKGYNEPFLVLSPPNIGTKEDDGILTMSEVMLLENNADLVILSACNTAMGENQESEGFSGLAKAFLYSGAKSIFVSNWYVETFAAKELATKMVSKMFNSKINSAQALNETMKEFIQENPTKSHPFYWAPFVMVGKNITLQ